MTESKKKGKEKARCVYVPPLTEVYECEVHRMMTQSYEMGGDPGGGGGGGVGSGDALFVPAGRAHVLVGPHRGALPGGRAGAAEPLAAPGAEASAAGRRAGADGACTAGVFREVKNKHRQKEDQVNFGNHH